MAEATTSTLARDVAAPHAHSHAHHGRDHDHHHPAPRRAPPVRSLLALSAPLRLALVAPAIAALWLLTLWAVR
jgi:ABC-type Zn2+ transport system substrate-binding protein/surface adhesin